jgi:hypothetical protein
MLLKSKFEGNLCDSTCSGGYEILSQYKGRAKNEIFEKEIMRT